MEDSVLCGSMMLDVVLTMYKIAPSEKLRQTAKDIYNGLMLCACVSKEKGFTPFCVNSKYDNEEAPLEERIQQPVEKWLRAFYDAEFVITDSFHACVFSIIFNKPFIVYGNKERGYARFESLLNLFALEDRLVSSPYEVNKALQATIDWNRVNSIRKQMKEKSLSFLAKNLNLN